MSGQEYENGVPLGDLSFRAQNEPGNPPRNAWTMWMSNGTGVGDNGDIMVKINSNGTLKYCTTCDFSNASTYGISDEGGTPITDEGGSPITDEGGGGL